MKWWDQMPWFSFLNVEPLAHVFTLLFHFHQIPEYLSCLLRNLYTNQEQQLEMDMEQQTGSK